MHNLQCHYCLKGEKDIGLLIPSHAEYYYKASTYAYIRTLASYMVIMQGTKLNAWVARKKIVE